MRAFTLLSGRISAGICLGEQALATLFQDSRTSVREALIRLEARGIVQVSPRRGGMPAVLTYWPALLYGVAITLELTAFGTILIALTIFELLGD